MQEKIEDRWLILLIVLFAVLCLFACCLLVMLIRYWRDESSAPVTIIAKNELHPPKEQTDNSSTDDSLPATPPEIIQIDYDTKDVTSVLAGDGSIGDTDEDSILHRGEVPPRTSVQCLKLNFHHLNFEEASIGPPPLPQNLNVTVSGRLPNDADGEDSSIVQNFKAATAGLRGESSANATEL